MKYFKKFVFRETYTLTQSQTDWIKETEAQVYKLIEETPSHGKKFAKTVRHMLEREEIWNNWKNDGCKGTVYSRTISFLF